LKQELSRYTLPLIMFRMFREVITAIWPACVVLCSSTYRLHGSFAFVLTIKQRSVWCRCHLVVHDNQVNTSIMECSGTGLARSRHLSLLDLNPAQAPNAVIFNGQANPVPPQQQIMTSRPCSRSAGN